MKKILLAGAFVFSIILVKAQQSQGTVTYDRISQLQMSFQGMPGGMEQQMPKSRTDKFELSFGANQSLWKQAERENEDEGESFGGEGMQIRMIVAGNNDVLYTNLESGNRVEKREMFEKTFVIADTISKLKWKMTGETKTILNMPCMKAVASRISARTAMNIENGKMERKEVMDTSEVVAWFTSSVPVSAGPAEFQGQLPGLILEMDISNGRQVFKATGFKEKVDLAAIKAPTGKKILTAAEFREEREKMFKEMQQNNQGGQRIIRMQ